MRARHIINLENSMIETIKKEGVDTTLMALLKPRLNLKELPHRRRVGRIKEKMVGAVLVLALLLATILFPIQASANEAPPPVPSFSEESVESKEIYLQFVVNMVKQNIVSMYLTYQHLSDEELEEALYMSYILQELLEELTADQ